MDEIQITKKTKTESTTSDRLRLAASLKAVKKGQCIEYRGKLSNPAIQTLVSNATLFLDKKLSVRKTEGGKNIFCE